MRTLMDGLVIPTCPPPYYALGHSTGGHILLRVLRTSDWFRKAMLVSPLVDILYGPWPRPVAALLVNGVTLRGPGLALPAGRPQEADGPERLSAAIRSPPTAAAGSATAARWKPPRIWASAGRPSPGCRRRGAR